MVKVNVSRESWCLAALCRGADYGASANRAGAGRQPGGAEPITSIEERTKDLKKIDGFFPLYLDEAGGKLWLEIPKLDDGSALLDGPRDRPRLERHRPRSRRPHRLAHRQVRARRPAGPDGAAELPVPRADHERG